MNRGKAFTLIEVLVVICISSLAAGLLLPALARARQEGRSVVCMSNMRQMFLAAQSYTIDNDGYYPMAYVVKREGAAYIRNEWDFCTTTQSGQETVGPGLLWQGEMIEKIQQCPAFHGEKNWGSGPYCGYNYNASYLGGSAAVKDGQVVAGTLIQSSPANAVRKADQCAIFGDGEYPDGPNKFMRAPFPGRQDEGFYGRYAGTQGYRHSGSTNVCYCDGSVRATDKVFIETDEAGKEALRRHNQNNSIVGFLSADNSAYDLD